MRRFARFLLPFFLVSLSAVAVRAAEPKLSCEGKEESGLPLPSTFLKSNDPAAFQRILAAFLEADKYATLGWCVDKGVRDTGPYIAGAYYGTHPVVRVWYSPA